MPVLKGGNEHGADKPAPEGPRESGSAVNLDHLLNMELSSIVVLAERTMRIEDVLELRAGSIIEFPKSAEDLLDLQVNNRTIARGETVKDGEKFGLQIRQINRVQDTVRALGQI